MTATWLRCYFHPELPAVATDSIVDLTNGATHETAYKRVPICWMCEIERRNVNTSRVEPIVEGRR